MGGAVDFLFGGGASKGSKDLRDYIGRGMDERRQGEQGAESAMSPYMGDPVARKKYQDYLDQGADSQGLYNKIMQGYQQSPFAKYQTEAGNQAITQSGAASGMRGSGDEMKDLQENAQRISSGDMKDYINTMLGMRRDYSGGLRGLADTEANQQYGARGQVGNWRYDTGNNLAGDYMNQGKAKANEDVANAGGWNTFISRMASMFTGGVPPR